MSYEQYQHLHIRVQQGVAFVAVEHPPLNLLGSDMVEQLGRFLDEVEHDDAVRVMVFESALPGFFLSNYDLEEMLAFPPAGPKTGTLTPFHLLVERYRTSPKVTIARIEGLSSGGGNEFALALDLRFAARESAIFLQPEVSVGLIPGGGGTQRLPRVVGRARALEMILGAQPVDAELAERYGLVNRSLPAEELGSFVEQLAFRIASFPAYALRMVKQAVDEGLPPFYDGLREEAYLFDQSRSAPETVERLKYYLQNADKLV